MVQGIRGRGWRAAAAAALLCVLAPVARAQAKVEVLSDQAQILKRFPRDTGLIPHGARVRLRSGDWLEITDNPFGKAAPELCWYVPDLHVAGVCLNAPGVTVTTLIELHTGRRVSAPGLAVLVAPGLIAVGPDKARGADADSLTLVQVQPDELVDEGGALFDDEYGPGAWVDADCYRLTPKRGKAAAWLEKTAQGWQETAAAQSAVCQGRHAK